LLQRTPMLISHLLTRRWLHCASVTAAVQCQMGSVTSTYDELDRMATEKGL